MRDLKALTSLWLYLQKIIQIVPMRALQKETQSVGKNGKPNVASNRKTRDDGTRNDGTRNDCKRDDGIRDDGMRTGRSSGP